MRAYDITFMVICICIAMNVYTTSGLFPELAGYNLPNAGIDSTDASKLSSHTPSGVTDMTNQSSITSDSDVSDSVSGVTMLIRGLTGFFRIIEYIFLPAPFMYYTCHVPLAFCLGWQMLMTSLEGLTVFQVLTGRMFPWVS